MRTEHTLLNEKYRPKNIEEFQCESTLKNKIQKWIDNNDIPNLLLYGDAGVGKTTLAKMLVNSLNCEHLYINFSDENGIDTVREKIKDFASTGTFKDFKVVILDEADYSTGNAQGALRALTEEYSMNTRFILTCNYLERIIEPLQSRCTPIKMVPSSKSEFARRVVQILDKEQIKYSPDLSEVKLLIETHYPDLRKTLNSIEDNTVKDVLTIDKKVFLSQNYKTQILNELKTVTSKTLGNIRQIIANSGMSDFYEMYRFLFENIDVYGKDKIGEIIVYIEEYQFHANFKMDRELNITALLSRIVSLLK